MRLRTALTVVASAALAGAALAFVLSAHSSAPPIPAPGVTIASIPAPAPPRTGAAADTRESQTGPSTTPDDGDGDGDARPVHDPAAAAAARTVARRFLKRFLPCAYAHWRCSHLPGLFPAYAKVLEPQLAHAPAPPAGQATRPALGAIRIVLGCRHAVAIATYTIAGHQLLVHPNLALEPDGWQINFIPELPAQTTPPRPSGDGRPGC